MDKLLLANFKMNPSTLKEAVRIAKFYDKKGVVIAPPFVFAEEVGRVLKKAKLGAQDVFWKEAGPYTSETSWRELKSIGVRYVIVGHSERRALGETDAMVNKKLKITLAHGLKAVLCVGEPKRESRMKNSELRKAKRYVKNQLERDLVGICNSPSTSSPRPRGKFEIRNLIVAYEPVWAIGTGRNDTPKDASEMAGFIKGVLDSRFMIRNFKVLYGGSVNSKNAKAFLEARDIDGLLVGGASLKPAEFKKIILESGKI